MKKAGFPSGKYTGSARPLEVGVAGTGTGTRAAEITQAMLGKLGIKVKLRFVTPDAYITKFCGVPREGRRLSLVRVGTGLQGRADPAAADIRRPRDRAGQQRQLLRAG